MSKWRSPYSSKLWFYLHLGISSSRDSLVSVLVKMGEEGSPSYRPFWLVVTSKGRAFCQHKLTTCSEAESTLWSPPSVVQGSLHLSSILWASFLGTRSLRGNTEPGGPGGEAGNRNRGRKIIGHPAGLWKGDFWTPPFHFNIFSVLSLKPIRVWIPGTAHKGLSVMIMKGFPK